MTRNLLKWRRRLESYLNRPSYVLLVAAIAAVNSFIPFFPVEVFVILRVLLRPKEWGRLTVIASVASAVAAVALAHLFENQPHSDLAAWLAHRLGHASWDHVSQIARQHGPVGLTLVSISILPLPPAIVVCALSKVPDWKIALSITLGHCLKYGLFAWMAAYSPRWFADAQQDATSA